MVMPVGSGTRPSARPTNNTVTADRAERTAQQQQAQKSQSSSSGSSTTPPAAPERAAVDPAAQQTARERARNDPGAAYRAYQLQSRVPSSSSSGGLPQDPLSGMPPSGQLSPGQRVEGAGTVRGADGSTLEVSVSASVSESLAPGLESSVSLEVSGRVGVGASGQVDIGAGSVEAGATAGATGTYTVTVPAAEYDRIRQGQASLPNPFDPASMPTGSAAVMNAEDFGRTELGGSFRNIAVQTGHQESSGTSIGVSKVDDDTVRVFAGPTEAVQSNLQVGLNAGPFSVGIGADRNLRESVTKTVDIDISTPEGQAAYHDFLRSGRVPSSDVPGVSNSGTIEELSFGHQTSAGAEVNIGNVRLGGFSELNSSEGNLKVTTYDDGRRTEERMARINGTSLHSLREFDEDGDEIKSRARTDVLMDDVHPASAGYLEHAFTGAAQGYDGEQDVQLSLNQRELTGLQERIQDFADRRGGLQMMGPQQQSFFEGILNAKSPDEAAAAFVRASSSGHVAEALLGVYADSQDEGPLPGRIQIAPDAVR